MSYLDLGFDKFLKRPTIGPGTSGDDNTGKEIHIDQILKKGRFGPETGAWYLDFDTGEVSFPPGSIKGTQISFKSRDIKAVVSNNFDGAYKDLEDAVEYVNRNGGGTIYIDSGTYVLNKSVRLYSDISLVGAGPGRTIIDFNNTTNNIWSYFSLIEFSKVSSGDADSIQNIHISGIEFRNSTNQGAVVSIGACRNATISQCMFRNNYADIDFAAVFPGAIYENYFLCTNSYDSIDISGGYVNVYNNYISGTTTKTCIDVSTTGCKVINNNIEICNIGINIGADECVVSGNSVSSFYGTGILINQVSVSRVDSNYVVSTVTSDYGIFMNSCSYCNVTNNSILGGTSAVPDYVNLGISIGGTSAYNSVVGNTIFGSNSACIKVQQNANRNSVTGNALSHSVGSGIYIDGDRTVVSGNLVQSNDAYGIATSATADRSCIVGNISLNNGTSNYTNGGTNTTAASNVIA